MYLRVLVLETSICVLTYTRALRSLLSQASYNWSRTPIRWYKEDMPSPRKTIYCGRKYMIFWQPGKKYMASGNKIYDFSTARKKIYDQWEKNICFFDTQEKNIWPMGIKYMVFGQPGKKYMTNGNKIYDILTAREWNKNLLILPFNLINWK